MQVDKSLVKIYPVTQEVQSFSVGPVQERQLLLHFMHFPDVIAAE